MSLLMRFWKSETSVVLGDVLIALCLLVSFSRTAHSVCPYGWKDYPGSSSCYLITDYQVRYSFDRAIDQCTAHQGHLVVIDEQTEMTWLGTEIQQIVSAGIPPKMAWWIGIEDKGQGVRYLNGSDINMDLLPWSGGVPQTPATSRRCGSFMNGKVYLSNCSSWFGLVCERSKALPLLCDVENAWVFINGSCFKYFPSQMTWFLAKSTCEQFEADLPKVITAEEVAFIWDKAKMSSTLSWIGLKSDIGTRTYKWTDGSTLDPSLLWWNTNQPQDLTYMMYTDPDICGFISGNGTRRLSSWMTEDCNERHSFTCSKPQGLCADGWISHQGMCIKFFPKYLLSWSSARQYCQSMGADLIIIPTQSYQDLVNLYLKELSDAAVDSFWLGIEDSGNQTFGWVNHKYTMNWTNWAEGAVKNKPETHEVAFISTEDKYGKWQLTSDLSARRAFACFISGIKPIKDVPPPLDITCPDQWEVAGDSCVFVSYNAASWSQADNDCRQLQSQLMVVNSAAAQSFLNSRMTTGQFWIGLSDRTAEGTFIWVNGTQLDLASWATGQPDNRGNENCVVVTASREGAKWYDLSCREENNYICQRQPLNKSGSTYPATTASPVAYSARCGIFWEERPGTNFCYQFRDTALSWSDALETCNSFNGSLVSITSRDEQSYIEGRLSSLTSADFWLGASDRRREAGWQWEDDSPFAYLNWFPSEPNDRSSEDCVAMNTGTMMWYDYPCNRRIGFVCKRVADNDQVTPTPVMTVPTALPDGQYYGCPLGWLSYENSCYLLRKVPTTWLDAQMACRQEGAALASVSSVLENKFIWSQLPKEACQNAHSNDSQCQVWADANECQKNPSWMSVNCRMACSLCTQTCSDKHTHYECRFWASIGECRQNPDWMWENCALSCGCDPSINEGFWLGLNDRHSQMTFVWDDLSPVTFTNWLPNEPNNYKGKNEDCVKMHTTDGEWSDEKCDQENTGYICEKKMAVLDTPTISPDKIGCPIAGFAYGSRCFVIIDSPKTWLDAKDYCSMKNATLATIPDSITGAFITSELVHKTSSYWIGLSNMAGMYRWDSGSDVQYLAWSPSHTGNQNDSCVAMRSQKPVGLWEDLKCQSLQPFICETYRRGFTQAAATTTSVPTTLTQCPPSWADHSNHCYKMFFSQKNWFDAQTACEGYGGSLVSIPDDSTNVFIKSLTGWKLAGAFWIGLNDRDEESSYVWSDGSPFQYSKWAKGEPNSATPAEDCVEELATTMVWNDVNCYVSRAYACAIVQGVPLPTVTPSVSTTEAPTCQDAGWWFHNGSCYYFSPEYGKNASMTWFESRRICQWLGGDLASVTSEDEDNFLTTELSRRERSKFWIGLNQLEQTSYVWTDGSPQSFVAWGPNEPNNFMGGERCVVMDGDRGIWQDEECMADHGFVCKKPNETFSTTPPVSTPAYMGTCPEGFVSGGVNNKCYYIGGWGNLTSDDPKRNWVDARNFCRNLTSPTLVDIGSIHSLADQDFVTSLMYDVGSDLWIGLSDRLVANQYQWQDNSEVTFTNWASGQPLRHFVWTLNQDNCVEMLQNPHRTEDTAKWNDAPCSKKNAFLCQTFQTPATTSSPPSTTSGTGSSPVCPTNFFLYKSACYSVVTEMKTWPDARNSCQSFNGDLASTSDIFEVARLDLAVLSSGIIGQAWIGMKFDQISSEYVFSDGWPVKHTFWSKNNPNLQTNDSCVALSLASWDDTLCSEVLPYICEIKSEAPPAPTSASAGKCPDPSQVSFGDSCYVAKLNNYVSWPEASYKCGQLGMEMASVHSEEENSFLKSYVEHVAVPDKLGRLPRSVWLGLQKDLPGGYRWSDRSQVTYFNWGEGEPSALNSRWIDEECVELYRDTGQWNDLPCLGQKLGYICKISKIFPTTSSPTTESTQTSAVTSAGTITTVVIGPYTTNGNATNMPWTSAGVKQSSSAMLTPAQSPHVLDEDENTLSAGKVAGIVIGIVGFIIIMIGVISIIRHRNISGKYKHFPKMTPAAGYENALYTQEQDVQSGEITGEVTIGASDLHRQSIELDSRVVADVSET